MVTRCHSLYHSLSLVVIRCHSLYHSLSFDVIHCHSLSLDVPLVYLFINDSLAQQFTSKSSLNRVFILQKKFLRIITFSFYKDHSNPLFKNLKLLKFRDILESEIIKFFYKFSRYDLPKQYVVNSIQFMTFILVIHVTICQFTFQECLPLDIAITPCVVMVLLYRINSLKIFSQTKI